MSTTIEPSLSKGLISNWTVSVHRKELTIEFDDFTFTFHAQWLYDASNEEGAARDANTAFCRQPATALIKDIQYSPETLVIMWENGVISRFPSVWLRVFAPIVAQPHHSTVASSYEIANGWSVETLNIREFNFNDIFRDTCHNDDAREGTFRTVLGCLLQESAPGIIKVVESPAPNIDDERNSVNTIATRLLKALFGGVFQHPMREADMGFIIASHDKNAKKAPKLPNYDMNTVLLPHQDHVHYLHPAQIMGLYGLEGESENTFVSIEAVLSTLKNEAPTLFERLCDVPVVFARAAYHYGSPLFQGAIDTPVARSPESPNSIRHLRWHPNLAGMLLAPFDKFNETRVALQTWMEIMRRDALQLKVLLKPGDMYVWNNFKVLHGRERVLKTPRTAVGNTVTDQVVADRYRALKTSQLRKDIEDKWLVHMPISQLDEMIRMIEARKSDK